MIERDDVLQALIDGGSIRNVARRFDVPGREVRDTLRQAVKELADGEALREEWFLEEISIAVRPSRRRRKSGRSRRAVAHRNGRGLKRSSC